MSPWQFLESPRRSTGHACEGLWFPSLGQSKWEDPSLWQSFSLGCMRGERRAVTCSAPQRQMWRDNRPQAPASDMTDWTQSSKPWWTFLSPVSSFSQGYSIIATGRVTETSRNLQDSVPGRRQSVLVTGQAIVLGTVPHWSPGLPWFIHTIFSHSFHRWKYFLNITEINSILQDRSITIFEVLDNHE